MILKMKHCAFVALLAVGFAYTEAAKAGPQTKGSLKDSWAALSEIQAGNKRFSEGKSTHAGQDSAIREKLAGGQQPPVIVVSCSDSRVPPEKIFDQGLGQVFTIRLAGHVLNSDAIASIEYALDHLGAKTLVIMGHDSCGAVKAALITLANTSTGSPHLDSLLSKIRPAVSAFKNISSEDKTIEGPVKANVTATVKDLVKRSKIVREFIENDRLLIAQGIYHLGSGLVVLGTDSKDSEVASAEPKKKKTNRHAASENEGREAKHEISDERSGANNKKSRKSTQNDFYKPRD
ncbi:MAG: hypothetical protein B7Y39_18445 [Bdellovibrio sp. 28-41-41]|nr:MAG: hypothetical protein B7Y39_18445 [Bdellovibrio sp. 28-41-41]